MSNGWTFNNPYSAEEELASCIADSTHMISVDSDGYCDCCGQQGGVEFLDDGDKDDHG